MKRRWRSFWFFVGFLPLLLALWLVWVLPDLGFFRLDTDSFSLPQNGMVLVERKEGKVVSSSALAFHGIGWQALWELWPLMLICVLAGYSLGVGYHWLYRLLAGGQPSSGELSSRENELKELTDSQRDKLCQQAVEIKELRTQVQKVRGEIFDQLMASGERGKQAAILERKVESQQRELFNTRAKIKRLEAKRRRKSVDHRPWPEYSDDM